MPGPETAAAAALHLWEVEEDEFGYIVRHWAVAHTAEQAMEVVRATVDLEGYLAGARMIPDDESWTWTFADFTDEEAREQSPPGATFRSSTENSPPAITAPAGEWARQETGPMYQGSEDY